MGKKRPKVGGAPTSGTPKAGAEPDSYKTKYPVWRFRSFDWDGPWGVTACLSKDWRKHIEQHLASFETMTWAQIEQAFGGKTYGANSHYLSRNKFSPVAIKRLEDKKIHGDSFFSLRLENTVRIYGIREDNCLRIIWFDPYHFRDDTNAAYRW